MQLEMAQVFLNDVRHRHAQCRGEILHGQRFLFFRVFQKPNQAIGQVLSIAGLIELDRETFPIRHLAKIRKVGRDNGNAIRASQVGHAATTGRRGVGHYGDGGTLEKVRQIVLVNVSSEFDVGFVHALLSD
jgi:hypothetical protein